MHDDLTLDAAAAAKKFRRRDILGYSGGAALTIGMGMLNLPSIALAQAYPAKPIRMIIAFPPAGATDILARLVGQGMAGILGQPVMVDNRPGAGGMIGLDAGAKAQPDGYNVFLCALTNQAIAGHLYPKSGADITRDFEPVSLIANGAHILNVHPSVPAKTLGEFTAWLRANDGKIDYASQGNGTLSHLEAELLQQRLGIKAVHVPYRGSSPALIDLISGKVSFMFDSVAASQPFIKTGQLRPLAVAASHRIPAFPDLPTIAEAGVEGYDADNWFGLFAPKGTAPEAISHLNQALEKVLANANVAGSLQQKGYIAIHGNPKKLASITTRDRTKWGEVIKIANIQI